MADGAPWLVQHVDGWEYRILVGVDGLEGFTDVEVRSPEGGCWVGTVGTVRHVSELMDRFVTTGECLGGAYLWVAHLAVVRDFSEQAVVEVLKDLVRTGEIGSCFEEVESDG